MKSRNLLNLSLMFLLALLFTVNGTLYWSIARAASHREAPITALDHTADITDWYTFVSYDPAAPNTVTMILDVDPFLEPSNGPNYFPFDPEIVYRMNVDNNQDGEEEIRFDFRFVTEFQLPKVFTTPIGADNGINAPSNAPNPPIPNPVIPPAVTALDGPGSEGLNLRQHYTVTMTDGEGNVLCGPTGTDANGHTLFAVPTNVGPRTMPNYAALAEQGIYTLGGCFNGARVFAGTVDDPFYIDLGATFDSLNLRVSVLTPGQDANDTKNVNPARDDVSGFNVNSIALEVPITMLTSDNQIHPATDPQAVIGTYGQTLRPITRTFGQPIPDGAQLQRVQRMGNALINELIIGIGSKDKFSMDEPVNDSQFANFFLDPLLPRAINAATGGAVKVPDAPRNDLLPLVTYVQAVFCPNCTTPLPAGPISDLLRLNTGIPGTPVQANNRLNWLPGIIKSAFAQGTKASRLGVLGGDPAGYPNGRRVFDDVTDISLRVVAGVLAGPPFNQSPNNLLGDGVNHNDRNQNTKNDLGGGNLDALGYQDVFPYVAFAHSGRDSRHIDANEPENLGGGGGGGGGCAIAASGSGMGVSGMVGAAVMLIVPIFLLFGRRLARKARKG